MSFRFERKALFHFSDYIKIKKLIFDKGGSILFPKRFIKSLYFDNYQKQTLIDSEEGSHPRKKIRIRTYPESNLKNFFLEKKISSVEGRFKLSKILKQSEYISFLKNGVFDEQYGNCYPLMWVTYEREYFSVLGKRVTLDKNIKYKKYNQFKEYFDNENVILEAKSNMLEKTNIFDDLPQFTEVRVSKYCNSIHKNF